MNLTLISTVAGIVTSALPTIMRTVQRRQELAYDLHFEQTAVDAATKGFILDQVGKVDQPAGPVSDPYESPTAERIIEGLKDSIRPVVTYLFFGLFLVIKTSVAWAVLHGAITMDNLKLAANLVFDENTTTLFSTILGFWFGSRLFQDIEEYNTRYEFTIRPLSEKEPK